MNASSAHHFSSLIQQQSTLEGACEALIESARSLGWDLASFKLDARNSSVPRGRHGDFVPHAMGWPTDFIEHWLDAGMGRDCPVASRCREGGGPFSWNCDPDHEAWRDVELTTAQRKVLQHYAALLRGGLAVPVQRTAGASAYVSWGSKDAQFLRGRAADTLDSALLLSHVFIYHAEHLCGALSSPESAQELSSRELECLNWAARGKTEEEIGLILSRSAATVHFHMRNAVIKLDASNRTHAVAIACTRGLIRDVERKNYLNS